MTAPPLSLNARLLIAALAALIAFLGATAAALDAAFRDSASGAARDRLQGHVYTLLAAANLDPEGQLFVPDSVPEARFSRPGSGLYAQVDGEAFRWQSESQLGALDGLPPGRLSPGETLFAGPLGHQGQELFVLHQGVAWELDDGSERRFTFSAAESTESYHDQIRRFRRALWGWLGAATLVLLAIQGSILRWGLKPLRAIAAELQQVERGDQSEIEGRYPQELLGLSDSLNAFIRSERRHLDRYRNSLADLAHSLKTPLAVMRSALDTGVADDTRSALDEQIHRMDDIVAYQLKRGGTSGHRTLAAPVPVRDCLAPMVRALSKLHQGRDIRCDLVVEDSVRFFGDRGDLMEVAGNLLDNAFKWADGAIRIEAEQLGRQDERRPGLRLVVDDDGPGMDESRVEALMERGVRGDEQVQGHGIGLAMVREIVDAYDGQLAIERSPLGGARVAVGFPGQGTLQ